MNNGKYEFLIVGSGAGGATLAKELSKKNKRVLVIEKGKYEQKIGTFQDSLRFYDGNKLTKVPKKSKEGVILYRTIMAGGSTVVSYGNATRCLEEELADFGINLDEEFAEAESEMNVLPIDRKLLSEGSEKIMWASKELGYQMELMPKFINPDKCKTCGQCSFGCAKDAKWTALNYLEEAKQNGIDIIYNTSVEQVLTENGKVKSIRGIGLQGEIEILSKVVILAAGGLGTPVILQQSGVKKSGSNLFVDLLVNTYGITENINQINELTMALIDHEFYKTKGFILSPHVNSSRMVRFIEMGIKGLSLPINRLIGIMNKISDEPIGHVYPDGTVSKPVTEKDWRKLKEGSSIASEILIKAGGKPQIYFGVQSAGSPSGWNCRHWYSRRKRFTNRNK